jgi:hypothetical protein
MMAKMKRLYVLGLVVALMFSFTGSSLEAKNMGEDFYLKTGLFWAGYYDAGWWTTGVNMDFKGKTIMLSPEVMVYGWRFDFDTFSAAPAAIVNVKFKSFFIGGGIGYIFHIGSSPILFEKGTMFKLNAGYKGRRFKVTVFALAVSSEGEGYGQTAGISIGFKL